MTPLVASEIVIIIFGAISLLSLYSRHERIKTTKIITVCTVLTILWLSIDALSYLIEGHGYSAFILYALNLLSYLMGGIIYIVFLMYMKEYIGRRTKINPYLMYVPCVIMAISLIVAIISFFRGEIVRVEGDAAIIVGGMPSIIPLIHIILQLYIIVPVFLKKNELGIKPVLIFSIYGIAPSIAIITVKPDNDATVAASAIALYVVVILLQRDNIQRSIEQMNMELKASNEQLQLANANKEEQLEKIKELQATINQSQESAIANLLDVIIRNESLGESIDGTVEYIGKYFDADRAYVFEEEPTGKYTVNTYEWCNEGIEPEKDKLQEVPIEVIAPWKKAFKEKGSIYVECDEEYAKEEPLVYEVLEPQGISSLLAAPMLRQGVICGFIGVDNPRMHLEHSLLIAVAASGINHEILLEADKKREKEQLCLLEEATAKAEEASKAKTVFLNNMSHDIRTPMNAIIGYTQLIRKDLDNKELVEDYLAKMEKSGEYLLSIINNILAVSRIDSGKETVDMAFADLTDESCSVVPVLAEELRRKNLTFKHSMDITHKYVFADMVKLGEIVMNILSNAIKYTPDGGTISLDFKEIPSEKEGYARYVTTISDTGIGMSKEFLEEIFDSFSRERNTTDSKIMGTGLGMSIVKKLVDLMGGTIEVQSELGKGTSFITTFDHLIVDNPRAYVNRETKHKNASVDLAGKKILLAEDNDLNAEIAIELLEDMGADIDRAEDGLICLEMLDKSEAGYYDLILMDIQMPNMNGYEAAVRIRSMTDEKKAQIPIIAMTANAFDEDRKMALEKGMNGHLPKPIDLIKLKEMLAGILD